jgi:cell division protein FtsI (penicillin-binding protein 3)
VKFEKRAPGLRLRLEGWRSRALLIVLVSGFAVLAGRAFYLQGLNNSFLQAKGEARYGRVVEMPASRGAVRDRQGQPLAISTPAESIWASPEDLEADDAQIAKLARALGMEAREIRQKVAEKDRQFAWLKRQISPEQAAKVMALRIPGVFQQREYRRFYPAGEVMAHVVGFTGIDDAGQEGIELAQQERLAGVAGSRRVIKDRKGRIVEDVESLRVPREGRAITLSIDQRLQFLAHKELKGAVEANKAKGGSLVVIDAKTGEVLALVNQPDYNPNNRHAVTGRQTRNRSVTDTFEPGSTFKPFAIAAALEAGIVRPDTMTETGTSLAMPGGTITDTHPKAQLATWEIVQKSSNIGTAKIALKMSPEKLWTVYSELGFGKPPLTGFPGEAGGRLRAWKNWRPIEQATMSYGYGVSVSLLQLARSYTLFTNDGRLLPVTLLKTEGHPIGKPILSAATAQTVSAMLERVVQAGGTATRAQVPGYRVAGKTGTAWKIVNGQYADNAYVATFVGYAPVSDPRYIIGVMIDEPSAGKFYGGDVSAPVFSQVMGAALRMMAVPPDAEGHQAATPKKDGVPG